MQFKSEAGLSLLKDSLIRQSANVADDGGNELLSELHKAEIFMIQLLYVEIVESAQPNFNLDAASSDHPWLSAEDCHIFSKQIAAIFCFSEVLVSQDSPVALPLTVFLLVM